MTIILSDAAAAEGYAAAAWYDRQQTGLGDDFLAALRGALQRIQAAPHSFALFTATKSRHELRQCRLKRFPYLVIFDVLPDDRLVAIAVAHASRGPKFWRERLSGEG